MCPQIVLHVGSAQASIGNRTVGGLTGSRVAGCFGRVPVASVAVQRSTVWRAHGFHAGSDVMCLCTWVDNLFSAPGSLAGAICILEDFEEQLESKWDMHHQAFIPELHVCARQLRKAHRSNKVATQPFFPRIGSSSPGQRVCARVSV